MEFALYRFLVRLFRMAEDHIAIKWHGKREEHRFGVSPDQLDRIERAGTDLGVNFQIAQFSLTVAFTSLLSLLFYPTPSETVKIVSICLIVSGFLLGLIFGVKWKSEGHALSKVIKEIRELPEIGPLGDNKQQLQPSDFDHLHLEAAPALPAPPPASVVTPTPEEGEQK